MDDSRVTPLEPFHPKLEGGGNIKDNIGRRSGSQHRLNQCQRCGRSPGIQALSRTKLIKYSDYILILFIRGDLESLRFLYLYVQCDRVK